MEAERLSLVKRAVDDTDGWADEDAILGGLEHVDRFLICRFAMIDDINTATNSPLHGLGRSRMTIHLLTEVAGDAHRRLHLFLPHHGEAPVGRRAKVVPGDVDLDVVDAFAAAKTDSLDELIFAIGDHAETFVVHVRLAFIAQPAGDGDLRACRADARSGEPARIHFIA